MKRKGKLIAALLVLAVLSTVWLAANPLGRFEWSCYAYSTYNACPRVISDFQVRADGTIRTVEKTHELTLEQIEWLLTPKPEVLIIAAGWNGVTSPEPTIRNSKGCEIRILKNEEAIELFNRLKRGGKRVSIHYHSTC